MDGAYFGIILQNNVSK